MSTKSQRRDAKTAEKGLLKTLGLAGLIGLAGLRGYASDVVFKLQDFTSAPQKVRALAIYPIGTPYTNGAGFIVTRDRVLVSTGTNGSVLVSNVYGGPYRSELLGTYTLTTNFFLFPVSNGVINASDWTTGPTNGLSGANTAYSQNAADGRFVRKAGDTMTGGLTNNVMFSGNGAGLTNIPSFSLPDTGTAGTYRSVTFDAKGRETSGSNPTTFSGYAISDTSANLAAALTDETGTGAAVFGNGPTIVTPTIASFANANHNHQNSAGGGVLDAAAITTGVFTIGRLATGTPDGTKFVRDDGTLAAPSFSLPDTGTAGTYRSVTFDAKGRETSGSNPTTFSGYAISDTSANLAAALTDETGTGAAVFGNGPTIVTPTIASFANANHNHQNSAGGGVLDAAAVTTGVFAIGLIPAIAESGVTGLVSDLAGKQAGPLTGDVTTSGGAATLKNTGTAGTYTKTTFDAAGRETSGTSATLASSDFANQGTTTTVLHGNASGNPSFAAVDVSTAEITGTLKAAAFPALTGDITTSAGSLATTLAAGNAGNLNSGTLLDARLSANVPLLNAANAWTGTSNYFSKNITFATNQNQIVPDFSIPEQLITTNAAFTFLAPVGIDLTKTEVQWTCVNVTNTTAVAVLVTAPANCHMIGTAYVTNWGLYIFQCYAQKITNCFAIQSF